MHAGIQVNWRTHSTPPCNIHLVASDMYHWAQLWNYSIFTLVKFQFDGQNNGFMIKFILITCILFETALNNQIEVDWRGKKIGFFMVYLIEYCVSLKSQKKMNWWIKKKTAFPMCDWNFFVCKIQCFIIMCR